MKRIKSVHPNPLVSDIGNQTLGPKGAIGRFDEWVRVHGSAELPNFRPFNAGWLLQYPPKYTIRAEGFR
jgi:hypothetical protein